MLIRKKLRLIIVFLVMIPMLLLCGIYYIYVSGELTENKKEEMNKILRLEQNYLDSFFDTRIFRLILLIQ